MQGEISSVICSTIRTGRYVALQRTSIVEIAINFAEVVSDSSPVDSGKMTVFMKRDKAGSNQQCPKTYPYAFAGGYKCCHTYQEYDISVDGVGSWTELNSRGQLHFDSVECFAASGPPFMAFPHPPCINYQFKRYGCYFDSSDLEGGKCG